VPFSTTVIDGGLDLVTAPQAVQPGRLLAGSNYEVARQRGIRRMDGYEKYDGGQSPSTGNGIIAFTTLQTTNPPFGMSIGDAMHFVVGGFPDQFGTVFYIDATSGTYPIVYVSLFAPLPYSLSNFASNPPTGGFAFFDDTTSNSYNILAGGSGAPSNTIGAPANLLLQAITDPNGTITSGTRGYRVTAFNPSGETDPSIETTVTVTAASSTTTAPVQVVNLTIPPGPQVLGYGFTVTSNVLFSAAQWVRCTDGTNSVIGQILPAPYGLIGSTSVNVDYNSAIVVGAPSLIPNATTVEAIYRIAMIWDIPIVPSGISAITGYNIYGFTPGAEQFLASVPPPTNNIPYYNDFGTITPRGAMPTTNTTGTVNSQLNNLAGNFTTISATVQQVPGQGNVNGIFWLKDRVYATRDYLAVPYHAGSTQPNVGDTIYQGASLGAATWSAQVARLVTSSGSWADSNDAAGVIMVYNPSGTLLSANAKNNTQGDITFVTLSTTAAASTAAGLYVALGERGVTVPTQSWQWCDLGWVVQYKSGANDFVDMNVALSLGGDSAQYVTTGWKVAGTATNTAGWNVGGGFPVANIAAPADSLYNGWDFYTGSQKPVTQTVALTNFGFTATDVPANASIIGIELQMVIGAIGRTAHFTAAPVEATIQFNGVANGPTPNLASSTPYAVVASALPFPIPGPNSVYGSYTWVTKLWGAPTTVSNTPTSLLGYTGITPADITATSFGISIGWGLAGTQTNQEIQVGIDYLAIRVTYLPQTNGVYFWNVGATSPSAVRAQVVMHYQQGGDLSLGSATGTLYFQFIQSDGTVGGIPPRPIGSDEQIRTWPANGNTPDGGMADGSTLLALTSVAADMNVMDWSALLTGAPQPDGSMAPASKYQSVSKNFYASSGLDAIYGVSGGGPAFYYDGIKTGSTGNIIPGNFSRILTGLPLQFETPRSVEAHQGHIFLGYYSGVIEWSNAVNVLSFDPALYDGTAGTNGFGERVIGIKSINGDSLCVWTQSTIQMMQGNFNVPPGSQVTSSLYTTTISPTSGGIEYTIQPMANYMYCDFRGITAIGATQKYGDFELGHYSAVIAPWLIPRVQLSSFFEGANIGIINSVLIRNKNMARYFFADGAALSMTFLEDNEAPQFTIQNYYGPLGVPVTWDVAQAFTEILGRDRIFGATADGTGWVYELERSNTFNGGAITGYATLVPDVAQVPFQNKIFSGVNVFGQAQDFAQFYLSRSANYVVPQQQVGTNLITEQFGSLTGMPTGIPQAFVSLGTAPLSIEGTAINLRFDFSSHLQFPHTIQAISYTIEPAQEQQE